MNSEINFFKGAKNLSSKESSKCHGKQVRQGCDYRLKTISIKLPLEQIEALDELVRHEIFASRSEAIRVAARDLLQKLVFEVNEIMRIEEKQEILDDDMKILENLTIT